MARFRNRGSFLSGPSVTAEQIDSNCVQTSWSLYATLPGIQVGLKESLHDHVTPGFRNKIAKGHIIMNPMTKTSSERITYPGTGANFRNCPPASASCVATGKFHARRQLGDWFPVYLNLMKVPAPAPETPHGVQLLISSSEIARLQGDTITKCWASRQLSDSNLYESVAEYRQTMRMFTDTFIKGRKNILRLLRNPKFRETSHSPLGASRNLIVGASSNYLMFRYGILPLVRDVQSIVKGLEKPRSGTVRKTTRTSGYLHRSKSEQLVGPVGGVFNIHYLVQTNDEVSVRAMSIDDYVASLAANIGFSDNGLLITPWELIPWSFVLDWFVNVGNYLQALAPMQGRKQLGSCFVTTRKTSTLYTCLNTTPLTASFSIDSGASGSYLATDIITTRTPALSPPELLIRPNFRFDELTRAADALALLVQVVSRLKK